MNSIDVRTKLVESLPQYLVGAPTGLVFAVKLLPDPHIALVFDGLSSSNTELR